MNKTNRCRFIKPDRQQCGCNRLKGDEFCYFHSVKDELSRREAALRGGLSPKRSYGNDIPVRIESTNDVLNLITETINDLRQNRASTRLANAVGYLAGIALKAIEQNELTRRLEEVEYVLKIKSRHR